MNKQAIELNNILGRENPNILSLLSEKGKNIFFPKQGILAQSADAKTKKINATIGAAIEDDGSIMSLKSIATEINMAPEYIFPYAPSYGRADLRKKWKDMLYDKNPSLSGTNTSVPVVTNALTHALSIVGYLFLNKEDKIIMPDLYWGNYNLVFKNGYDVEFNMFNTFKDGQLDLYAFEKSLEKDGIGKKVVLLNFPNNPTGYSPTYEEIDEICDILKTSAEKGNEIITVVDDAYFGLVFEEGIATESIFAKLAKLHENILAIKVDGPTKEDYVWGFRIGFITYAMKGATKASLKVLEEKTAGAIRGNISNASNLSQSLILEAYNSDTYDDEKAQKNAIITERYNVLKDILEHNKNRFSEYFTALPYNSGYFMCVRLSENLDGEEVRNLLLTEYDTGVINLNGVIRVAFSAVSKDLLEELFENLFSACKQLSE